MTDRATVAVADAKRLLEQRRRLAGKLMMVKGQLPSVCEKYLADKDWRGFFDEASRLTEGFLREMDDWMRESCVVDWNDFRVANAGFLLNVELSKNHRPTTAHEAVWLIGRLIAHVYDLCKMANDEPQTFDEQLRVANVTRLRDELATLPNAMTYYDSLYAESARWQRWLKDETEKQPPKPVEPHGETLASGDDAGGDRAEAIGKPAKLRPCDDKAWSQYRRAIEDNPELTTDQAAYDWFIEHVADEGESLPAFASWVKYVRLARADAGEQKNKRGVGHETRSVVPAKRL